MQILKYIVKQVMCSGCALHPPEMHQCGTVRMIETILSIPAADGCLLLACHLRTDNCGSEMVRCRLTDVSDKGLRVGGCQS